MPRKPSSNDRGERKPPKKPAAKRPPPPTPPAAPTHPGTAAPEPERRSVGRPPDEWRAELQTMMLEGESETFLRRCLDGEMGPMFFLAAMEHCAPYGMGAPVRTIHHEDPEDAPPLVVRVAYE